MRLIERTEKYVVDSEEDKTKKAKGEIIGEVWVTSIKKVLGGVWDDYE